MYKSSLTSDAVGKALRTTWDWTAGIPTGGFSADEHLKLSLETASLSVDGIQTADGFESVLIDLVTQNVVHCLQVALTMKSAGAGPGLMALSITSFLI
jgi:hypothetical protein